MRVKTEHKRAELLQAATEVFLEVGYDRTLMSDISARAECSKGTLYRYFASKEDLYFAVIMALSATATQAILEALEAADENFSEQLLKFGTAFLSATYSPKFQAMRRLAFAPNENEAISRTVYEKAVEPYLSRMSLLIAKAMENGSLRPGNATVAAWHLCGLLESELLLRFLLHALPPLPPEELATIAERAVSTFLAAYGPS